MTIEELDNQVKSFISKITTTGQLIDHLKDVQSSYEQVLATFDTINNDKKNVNLIAEDIKAKIVNLVTEVETLHKQHLQTLTTLKESILQSQLHQTQVFQDQLINFKDSNEKSLANLNDISRSILDFIKQQQDEIKNVFNQVFSTVGETKTELASLKEENQQLHVFLKSLQQETLSFKADSVQQLEGLKSQQGLILEKIAALHHRIENPPKKKFLGLF